MYIFCAKNMDIHRKKSQKIQGYKDKNTKKNYF